MCKHANHVHLCDNRKTFCSEMISTAQTQRITPPEILLIYEKKCTLMVYVFLEFLDQSMEKGWGAKQMDKWGKISFNNTCL